MTSEISSEYKGLIAYCDCRKTQSTPVALFPGIDPRFLVGQCSKCEKIHAVKKGETNEINVR